MDKRFFSNFWNKRSSAWTFGMCLTGVLVIGSIVAVDRAQRDAEVQPETALEQAYLEEELNPEDVNDTLLAPMNEEAAEEGGLEVSADAESAGDTEPEADALDGSMDEEVSSAASSYEIESAGEASAAVSEDASGEEAAEAASTNIISEADLMAANVAFGAEDTLMWPAAGTILIDYSMDGSVFFPTLNQYKYNPALVISSEIGNQVVSSAKGIVESVSVDEVTGLTMTVNIGDGYRLTYGQLKEAAAAEGDLVEAGSVLGYVSEPTRYYTKEGSNLYFQMTKDGAPVDPVLYLE